MSCVQVCCCDLRVTALYIIFSKNGVQLLVVLRAPLHLKFPRKPIHFHRAVNRFRYKGVGSAMVIGLKKHLRAAHCEGSLNVLWVYYTALSPDLRGRF